MSKSTKITVQAPQPKPRLRPTAGRAGTHGKHGKARNRAERRAAKRDLRRSF